MPELQSAVDDDREIWTEQAPAVGDRGRAEEAVGRRAGHGAARTPRLNWRRRLRKGTSGTVLSSAMMMLSFIRRRRSARVVRPRRGRAAAARANALIEEERARAEALLRRSGRLGRLGATLRLIRSRPARLMMMMRHRSALYPLPPLARGRLAAERPPGHRARNAVAGGAGARIVAGRRRLGRVPGRGRRGAAVAVVRTSRGTRRGGRGRASPAPRSPSPEPSPSPPPRRRRRANNNAPAPSPPTQPAPVDEESPTPWMRVRRPPRPRRAVTQSQPPPASPASPKPRFGQYVWRAESGGSVVSRVLKVC